MLFRVWQTAAVLLATVRAAASLGKMTPDGLLPTGCNASGAWHSVGSSDVITMRESADGTLRASAASGGFVDAPGRVYANASLLFLDCCVSGGIGGVFAGAAAAPCAVIAWADTADTHWVLAPPASAPAPAPAPALPPAPAGAAIDRRAVVERYPLATAAADGSALQSNDVFTLGNGDFVFNVDATGLQTFNSSFATQGPALDLNTLSSWAFHSTPAVADGTLDGARAALRTFNWTTYPTATSATEVRPITLATDSNLTGPLREWSMSNPHRVGLGQLAFRVLPPDAAPGTDAAEVNWQLTTSIVSALDMWAGSYSSAFVLSPIQGTDPFCVSTGESGAVQLQCADSNATIAKILLASYGAPLAGCPSPRVGTCSAANSTAVVEARCLGQNSCTVPSGNTVWGDPCLNTPKQLVVQAHCSSGGGWGVAVGSSATSAGAPAATTAAAAVLNSTFAVTVDTTVHPDLDLVAVRLTCTRQAGTQGCPTALRLALPYADGRWGAGANNWDAANDAAHQTDVTASSATSISLAHYMDDFHAEIRCVRVSGWRRRRVQRRRLPRARALPRLSSPRRHLPRPPARPPSMRALQDWDDATWTMTRTAVHGFLLAPPAGASAAVVQLSCLFAPAGAQYPVGNSGGPSYVAAKAAATLAALRGAAPLPFFDPTARDAAASMWASYWTSGAAVDLTGATNGADANAVELERRIVLSQYLTRANSAGMTPPQETGLLSNSWSGRFHLEMRWWHQAHFALWGRPDLLDRSHAFYFELLQNATSLAAQQGFRGARWQKMLALANRFNQTSSISVPWLGEASGWAPPAPEDNAGLLLLWESANTINPVCACMRTLRARRLIAPPPPPPPTLPPRSPRPAQVLTWNQGPVIWLADAIRRSLNATQGSAAAQAAVARLAPLVFATADCIADMPFFNETSSFFELGSPTLGAEEFGDFMKIRKPAWETVYFAVTLDIANEWRELLAMPRDAKYDAVAAGMGGLPIDPAQAVPTYAFNAEAACCYNTSCPPGRFGGRDQCSTNSGHPSPAAIFGLLNGRRFGDRYGVDAATANATVAAIAVGWDESAGAGWGWDTPLVALGQIRNGWQPEAVVDMLLVKSSHNSYWRTGWNWQSSFTYLPGNGGTLSAVAMMAGGTDTSPPCNFPAAWQARCEGFMLYP